MKDGDQHPGCMLRLTGFQFKRFRVHVSTPKPTCTNNYFSFKVISSICKNHKLWVVAVTYLSRLWNWLTDISFGCNQLTEVKWTERKLNFNELTSLVEVTLYYRYHYVAANGAWLEAFEGLERIHILEFSTTHCIQWPTFIDVLPDRVDGITTFASPSLASHRPGLPDCHRPTKNWALDWLPLLAGKESPSSSTSYRNRWRVCRRVTLGCEKRELKASTVYCGRTNLADETEAGPTNHLEHHHHEQSRSSSTPGSYRGDFARKFYHQHTLETSFFSWCCPWTLPSWHCTKRTTKPPRRISCPLKHSSYGFEWIPFDALATSLPCHLSVMCLEQEQEVGKNIENIVTYEAVHRIERLESKSQW